MHVLYAGERYGWSLSLVIHVRYLKNVYMIVFLHREKWRLVCRLWCSSWRVKKKLDWSVTMYEINFSTGTFWCQHNFCCYYTTVFKYGVQKNKKNCPHCSNIRCQQKQPLNLWIPCFDLKYFSGDGKKVMIDVESKTGPEILGIVSKAAGATEM